jgi:hypothetical protein
MQKASRAFEAAVERDCTWFQSNPAKTRLRRKVTGEELPRTLRGLGIAEVVISDWESPLTVTFKTAKKLSGLGLTKFWELAKQGRMSGNGPRVTQLSPQRIGISVANNAAWQASRARG